jgi:thioredoxin-related protein
MLESPKPQLTTPATSRLLRGAVLLVVVATQSWTVDRAVATSPVWHDDVGTAWQQALDEGRPLLMYISTKSCSHCRKMKSTTYADRDVATLVDESVVAVAIDGQRQRKLVRKHLVRAYPTTLVISPDGREVGRFEGYVSPDDFRRRLAWAVDRSLDVQHIAAGPRGTTR